MSQSKGKTMTTSPSNKVQSVQAEQYRGADGAGRRVSRLNKHERTPTNPRYDSRCPSCWLGHCHSQALHDARLVEATEGASS